MPLVDVCPRWLGLALCIMSPCSTSAVGGEVTIIQPWNDRVTISSRVTISGSGSSDGAIVQISSSSGSRATATVRSGKWRVTNFPLAKGDNVIDAAIEANRSSVLIVRGTDISNRGLQKVRFVWDSDVDEKLKEIARGTLTKTLSDNELNQYVTWVKERTASLFLERYKGFNIQLVTSAVNDVHTIRIVKATGNFGSSLGDCSNRFYSQESTVRAGAYRDAMVNNFAKWAPMRKHDSLDTRADDVAHALARTSAHELGHSLGLTASSGKCAWMNGCDDWHNCLSYDARQKLANRFDEGWFVMDPGQRTWNNARLSEPSRKKRTVPRVLSKFNEFSSSYLHIIHPLP